MSLLLLQGWWHEWSPEPEDLRLRAAAEYHREAAVRLLRQVRLGSNGQRRQGQGDGNLARVWFCELFPSILSFGVLSVQENVLAPDICLERFRWNEFR